MAFCADSCKEARAKSAGCDERPHVQDTRRQRSRASHEEGEKSDLARLEEVESRVDLGEAALLASEGVGLVRARRDEGRHVREPVGDEELRKASQFRLRGWSTYHSSRAFLSAGLAGNEDPAKLKASPKTVYTRKGIKTTSGRAASFSSLGWSTVATLPFLVGKEEATLNEVPFSAMVSRAKLKVG